MKNKLILTLLCAFSAIHLASAGRTDVGTWTAGGSALIDFDTYAGTEVDVVLNLGQYIETGLMAGGYGGFYKNDFMLSLTAGAMGNYHFLDSGRTPFSPYVGGDLGFAYTSTDDKYILKDSSNFALVLGVRLGMKFFLTEQAAIDTHVGLRVATADVFPDDGDASLLTNTDIAIRLGLAFFF